jgi:hypothetical protein
LALYFIKQREKERMQENEAVNICQMNRTIVEIFLIMIMQDQFQASEFATYKGPHFLQYFKNRSVRYPELAS